MGLSRFFKRSAGYTAISTGVFTGVSAATGASGAAILTAAGYTGYAVSEAANMGAIGGAIFGGGAGAILGGIHAFRFFDKADTEFPDLRLNIPEINCNILDSLCQAISGFGVPAAGVIIGSIASGLIGCGVLNSTDTVMMDLIQAAAAFAVGSCLIIPAAIIFPYCLLMMICNTFCHEEANFSMSMNR